MKLASTIKLGLVAGFTCFVVLNATAQKAYVKLGGGYNFGIGSAIGYQTTKNTSYNGGPTGFTKYERVNVNYGKGGIFGGAFGYMFHPNIGFELGVNYLAGAKSRFKNEIITNGIGSFGGINAPFNGIPFSSTETFTTQSQMVLVQPTLVIATGLPKFNPYTRIGLVVAKGNLNNTYSYSDSNGENRETEDKYFGGLGFGLQAAVGLNFSLNDKLAIYTEATFSNLTYAPEKGEVTKYTRNGTDMLHTLKPSQKEINFEDEQTIISNGPQPSSEEPSTGTKQRYTLNSVGLQAGFRFSF